LQEENRRKKHEAVNTLHLLNKFIPQL